MVCKGGVSLGSQCHAGEAATKDVLRDCGRHAVAGQQAIPSRKDMASNAKHRPGTSIQIVMICGNPIQNLSTRIPNPVPPLQNPISPILRSAPEAANAMWCFGKASQIVSICGNAIQAARSPIPEYPPAIPMSE